MNEPASASFPKRLSIAIKTLRRYCTARSDEWDHPVFTQIHESPTTSVQVVFTSNRRRHGRGQQDELVELLKKKSLHYIEVIPFDDTEDEDDDEYDEGDE